MRYRLLILAAAVPPLLWAQGGSNYSLFGVGDVRPSVGAFYDGANSYGIAVPSGYAISTTNPALWTFVRSTRLQGGYRFHQQQIQGETGTTAQNNGKVEGILTLFALDTAQGWALSWGVYPLSSVNVAVAVPVELHWADERLQGSHRLFGSGGLSASHFGVAVRPLPSLGFGMAFRYLFGLFRREWSTVLQDQWSAPDTLTVTDWIAGGGVLAGAWYSPTPSWLVAVALSSPVAVSTQQLWRYSFTHTYGDTTVERSLRWHLPASVGAGIAYRWGRSVTALEGFYADFSSLTFHSVRGVAFQPLYRLSLSFHRAPREGAGHTYWDRIGFSTGIGWQRLYYRIDGRSLSEVALSMGISLPLGQTALLELACQTGMRGRRAPGLVQEWFGRWTFTLTLGEQWFLPARRR